MSTLRFTSPPIDELIIGVHFKLAKPITTVDLGLFWATISKDFPSTEDQVPLIATAPAVFASLPPLRRVWMVGVDPTRLLQIQSDRFYFNWRKRESTDKYPGFEAILKEALGHWLYFTEWLGKNNHGHLTATRFEVTYIDVISKELGWNGPSHTCELIKIFNSLQNPNFGSPELATAQLSYPLPNSMGNLALNIKQALRARDGLPILVVEHIAQTPVRDGLDFSSWFLFAREQIRLLFLDIITDRAREVWGHESIH